MTEAITAYIWNTSDAATSVEGVLGTVGIRFFHLSYCYIIMRVVDIRVVPDRHHANMMTAPPNALLMM